MVVRKGSLRKSTAYRHFEVQPIKRAREATLQRFELEVVQLHEVAQQLLQEVLRRATTPVEHGGAPSAERLLHNKRMKRRYFENLLGAIDQGAQEPRHGYSTPLDRSAEMEWFLINESNVGAFERVSRHT